MCRCGMVKLMRLEYVPRVVQISEHQQSVRKQLLNRRILRLITKKKL